MLDRLAGMETEYEDVLVRLQDPNVFADQRAYVTLSKRLKELEPIVLAFREHRATSGDFEAARGMLAESAGEDREFLQASIDEAEATDHYRGAVIDDGESPDRASEGLDLEEVWGDEQLVIPNDFFGAPSPELERDLVEVTAGEPAGSDPSGSTIVALPDDIWGETASVGGTADPEFSVKSQLDDDYWLAGDHGDSVLDEPLVAEPRHDADVADFAASVPPAAPPAVRPGPRRHALAPDPVAVSRWSAVRRSLGAIQVKQRVAALALLVVAVAGFFGVMAIRGPNESPAIAPRQIDAGGIRPTSTMPSSFVLRGPSTSVTTPPAPGQTTPGAEGQILATTSSLPAVTTSITTTATTATTAPARSAATVAPAEPPAPPPAPTPTPTAAPPTATVAPPTTVVTPVPEPPAAPETTSTTRRNRPIVPDSTVPSTTSPSSTGLPGDEGK